MIVGCARYDDRRIPSLSFAGRDAIRFRDTLADVAGIGGDAVTVLADNPAADLAPTRDNVVTALSALVDGPAADTVHFFFSGHGFHSGRTGQDYLLLRNSRASAPEVSALAFDDVLSVVREADPSRIVLYLDACRENTDGKGTGALPEIDPSNLRRRGVVTFCSCGEGELSYEDESVRGGLFTSVLCRALSDEGRCVTVREVDEFLRRETPELARSLGKRPQRPATAVDPLPLQHVELVSAERRNVWRANTPIGAEVRRGRPGRMDVDLPDGAAIALDFGTSFSLAAVVDRDGRPHFVPSPDGGFLVPSVLAVAEDGDYTVGTPAVEQEHLATVQTIRNAKRHLGGTEVFAGHGRTLGPEFASSLIIRSLGANAEAALDVRFTRCLVAYPANFGIAQSNALLRAVTLAGFDVLRMVGEPNIASILLAGERLQDEGRMLVVDLGGGTFDVAMADWGEGVCEIQAVGGDNHLGGVDFDEALSAEAGRRLREQIGAAELSPAVCRRLLAEAQRVKHRLTVAESADFFLDLERDAQVVTFDWTVTRDAFREITADLTARIRRVVEGVLDDDRDRDPIDTIFLTGQGTKIFTVPELLRDMGIADDLVDRYREDAVARGLATYAGVLNGVNRDVLLLDLSHRGIGIGLAGLVPDTTVPARASDTKVVSARKDGAVGENVLNLLERLTTIPVKRSCVVRFDGAAGEDVRFTVVERSKVSEDLVTIGEIVHAAPGERVVLTLSLDVDANSTITLQIEDPGNRVITSFQINQQFRQARPLLLHERVRRLLDGWTVHPVRNLRPGEINVVADGGSERFDESRVPELVEEMTTQYNVFGEQVDRYLARGGQDQIATSLRDGYLVEQARYLELIARLETHRADLDAVTSNLVRSIGLAARARDSTTLWRAMDTAGRTLDRLSTAHCSDLAAAVAAVLQDNPAAPRPSDGSGEIAFLDVVHTLGPSLLAALGGDPQAVRARR